MMTVNNSHTCHLADAPDYDDPFNARHADQVTRATNSILTEMCVDTGVHNFNDLTRSNLNKRSVTKERLCEWIETLCYTLNKFASAHLQMAVERIDNIIINSDLLKEQQKVIDLQTQLLEKREDEIKLLKESVQKEVKTVQGVVESEMKSYSAALSKTCASALAPRKICAAVKTVADRDDRSRNLIVYGLNETDEEQLESKIAEVLHEINEKPVLKDCCRVGLKKPGSQRPAKFTLTSADMANQVLRKTKTLRTKEGYKSVYISPDRTAEERRAFRKLREELLARRKSEPNKVHVIRNKKIVSSDMDSLPAPSGNT